MKALIFVILFFLKAIAVQGQVVNDECQFGTYLGFIDDYCSEQNEFTNDGATQSMLAVPPECIFGDADHDVWFSFVPRAPAVYASISGELSMPSLAIYSGLCSDLTELGCASTSDGNFIELSSSDLIIGQVYYIRVDARNSNTGSFQLCIRSFAPIPMPESDCRDAVVLCDKSPFQVENLNQTGDVQSELTGSCVSLGQEGERASVWYVWTCKESGTLEFTITPNNPNSDEEDIDFVVYEMPGGIQDCENRFSVRCMLSGETRGRPSSPCYGPTGLRAGETDIEEFAGCNDNSNNFVAPLDMIAGTSYGMIINNFSQSGFGFSIEWGGTGTFLGPNAEFISEALAEFECDKSILFTDISESLSDEIVEYKWNFGDGSMPISADDQGPHTVIYESFGEKLASLTVTTSRGCNVTFIDEFYIEPCCEDLPEIELLGESTDVSCFGLSDGSILIEPSNGQEPYQFSINGSSFQPSPLYHNLPSGSYTINVQDKKGCMSEISLIINNPPEIIVNAGNDTVVDLGESIVLNASYTPVRNSDSIYWSPLDGFVPPCDGCLNPEIIPPGETRYALTVIDENGCVGIDDITIRVNIVRPVYWPNIITLSNNFNNNFFNLSGGPAIRSIKSLKIFDRWGGLLYDGSPQLNDPTQGWDGTVNNKPVNNGVYVWLANVEFIDDVEIIYSGDVTVIR